MPQRKVYTSQLNKNHEEPVLWKTVCYENFKGRIPDLYLVPSKWSVCEFSIKSYKKQREFWDRFAQISQKNSMIEVW